MAYNATLGREDLVLGGESARLWQWEGFLQHASNYIFSLIGDLGTTDQQERAIEFFLTVAQTCIEEGDFITANLLHNALRQFRDAGHLRASTFENVIESQLFGANFYQIAWEQLEREHAKAPAVLRSSLSKAHHDGGLIEGPEGAIYNYKACDVIGRNAERNWIAPLQLSSPPELDTDLYQNIMNPVRAKASGLRGKMVVDLGRMRDELDQERAKKGSSIDRRGLLTNMLAEVSKDYQELMKLVQSQPSLSDLMLDLEKNINQLQDEFSTMNL
jgi:hypothetical protein